jgi:hypothetical protein
MSYSFGMKVVPSFWTNINLALVHVLNVGILKMVGFKNVA